MNILFTVCGRAGSKGFKNKNLKELNGVPLVYYTLAAIKAYVDAHPENNVQIAINTDSPELIEVINNQKSLNNIIFVERKADHAGDSAPKVAVIQDTYKALSKKTAFDVIVDLDITSPMRRLEDIENIIAEYSSDCNYDVVFSVVKARRSPYFNMVEKKETSYYGKICSSAFTARQQAPQSYEMNASIYAYSPRFLSSVIEKTILDYNCGIVEMEDYLVLDIDSEYDFKMMVMLYRFYCDNNISLNSIYQIASNL
jgi:CMP-N,N'-diacetyllegionaminic acid synthase